MEEPSENININTSNEVRQNSFDEHIESILDSVDVFKEDFYDVFDSLPKTKQKTFVREVYEWISTVKFVRYYDRKYIRPRKKENPIFNFGQLDFLRAEQEDYLFLKGVRDREGLKYPATEIWIKRKTEEIKNFFEELELLYSSIQEKESLCGSKKEVDYRVHNLYQFPNNLTDPNYNLIEIDSSFRICLTISLDKFENLFDPSLSKLKAVLSIEDYTAFLYNSFQFESNNTKPVALQLKRPSHITSLKFNAIIHSLYVGLKTHYKIKKIAVAKICFINFLEYRANSYKSDFDLEKHLKSIGSNIEKL